MYKIKEEILGVDYFSAQTSTLIYQQKNSLSINIDGKVSNEYDYYGYLGDKFIQYGKFSKHYILNIESDEVTETPEVLFFIDKKKGFYTTNYIYDANAKRSKSDLFGFDILTKISTKILSNSTNILILVSEESLLFWLPKSILRSLSLLTGEYEWELDLGLQDLKIISILGVDANYLIIICKNEQNEQVLLSLDVHTGKELWAKNMQVKYSDFAFNNDKTSVFNIHAGGIWLNGIQMIRGNNIFREINTKNGSVRREGTLWQMDELGLGIKHYTLFEDKIYFTANYQGSFSAIVIGVLDYETLALLWWEKVSLQADNDWMGHFLVQLQVSENRIYALDDMGTLHIYERDETIPFEKPTKSGLLAFEDLPAQNIDNQNFNKTDDLPF